LLAIKESTFGDATLLREEDKMRKSMFFLVLLLFVIVIADSTWANGRGTNNGRVSQLRVMTLNFYIGADILGVIEPSPCGPLQSVNNLFKDIEASDPVARAEAHADLIEQQQPDVVTLQEMYLIRKQYPSNSFIPGTGFANFDFNPDGTITFIPDAEVVVYDYLDLLLEATAKIGMADCPLHDLVDFQKIEGLFQVMGNAQVESLHE
jgi:hypothetical protein